MILINKLSQNTVILTLAERTTLDNVIYLFEFIKDGSVGSIKYFLCEDVSTNKIRHNEFVIEDALVEDVLNGVINLDVCDYTYNIYEQTSTTNLDPTGLNLVENGKVQVVNATVSLDEFNEQQTTIVAFNG